MFLGLTISEPFTGVAIVLIKCDTTQDYMSRLLGHRRGGNHFLSTTIWVEFFNCFWSCLNGSSASGKFAV